MAIPILDTTVAVVSRIRRHLSPFLGGQDHLSHRLIRLGYTRKQAALLLWFLSATFAAFAILISAQTFISENFIVISASAVWVLLLIVFLKIKDA